MIFKIVFRYNYLIIFIICLSASLSDLHNLFHIVNYSGLFAVVPHKTISRQQWVWEPIWADTFCTDAVCSERARHPNEELNKCDTFLTISSQSSKERLKYFHSWYQSARGSSKAQTLIPEETWIHGAAEQKAFVSGHRIKLLHIWDNVPSKTLNSLFFMFIEFKWCFCDSN